MAHQSQDTWFPEAASRTPTDDNIHTSMDIPCQDTSMETPIGFDLHLPKLNLYLSFALTQVVQMSASSSSMAALTIEVTIQLLKKS